MAEVRVFNDVIIDEAEAVLEGIRMQSGQNIDGIETILRFIREEKNTCFYLNPKMNCKMQHEKGCEYIWLDTGFTTKNGKPLFISMIRKGGMYLGHYIGTMEKLASEMRLSVSRKALSDFREKYEKKIQQRTCKHIENEKNYLVGKCNGKEETAAGTLGSLILQLGCEFPGEEECAVQDEAAPAEETTIIPMADYRRTRFEEEITTGLLFDEIVKLNDYIDELMAVIDELSISNESKNRDIEAMKAKNEEYKRAMVQMRTFMAEENVETEVVSATAENCNHLALAGKKILVLGDCRVETHIMKAIARAYGFDSDDLEFQTDYKKAVNYSGRIKNGGRFYAVIFGANPHSGKGTGNESSIIEGCRRQEGMPLAVDARTKNGILKASKDSFKYAMAKVAESFSREEAI